MIPELALSCAVQRFEQPDILYSKFTTTGEVDLATAQGALPYAQELFEKRRDIYWIHNYGEAKGVSQEARQWMQEKKLTFRPYAFVGCGGSFAVRTVVGLIIRALKALGRWEGQVLTFKTEAEARAWIERDRAQRMAKSA